MQADVVEAEMVGGGPDDGLCFSMPFRDGAPLPNEVVFQHAGAGLRVRHAVYSTDRQLSLPWGGSGGVRYRFSGWRTF